MTIPRCHYLVRAILSLFITSAIFSLSGAAEPSHAFSMVTDSEPGRAAKHGIQKLGDALRVRGWTVEIVSGTDAATHPRRIAVGNSSGQGTAAALLRRAGKPLPEVPESLTVARIADPEGGPETLVLCGADDRGLMYAMLDAAERVRWAAEGSDPLSQIQEIAEQPFVRDRALSVYTMNRAHWESRFYDEQHWERYFDMLAASRFNRFHIIFGYENGGFLAPAYPYFFTTPGFDDVGMVDLTAGQQRKNLAALNRLIDLAHDRGLVVTLGIWDHIFRGGVQNGGNEWIANYAGRSVPNSVEGVTTENLNAYTLASLRELLARVPALDGLQFRMHEESGLKREEMNQFWRDVFTEIKTTSPEMLIEARAKGTPDSVIDTAVELGINLRIGTKHWMEQMGLPHHPTHVNPRNQRDRRHGYADLLRYPERYQMNWRLWNAGTTRILLWGSPEYVRRYSAGTALYDSPNWEVQEPLATKMEAQPPEMPTFDLMPKKYQHYDYEFERYWHFYQVWGRLGYNPDTSAEIWQREFQHRFGRAGPHLEAALHRASQVLPMIVASVYPYRLFPTTMGWPERQSLGKDLATYATNETTDIQQFESFADAARRILSGGVTTRRIPEVTSDWFDTTAEAILASVREAESAAGEKQSKEFDATVTDLRILAQLARFHARRSLAAVHYNLFEQGGNKAELAAAAAGEAAAIAAWRELVAIAADRYALDLAMGARNRNLAGHWSDELKLLESGLQALEARLNSLDGPKAGEVWQPIPTTAIVRPVLTHTRPVAVRPGAPLHLSVRVVSPAGIESVRLRYRHVTQFEDYETLAMNRVDATDEYAVTVPGDFIVPEWDLMYFIEIVDSVGHGAQWPELEKEAPYVIVKLQRD
jgi:hypothetical protein